MIFVTSYDQFALKAIKFNAADYILKPVDPDEFVEAVQRVQADLAKEINDNRIDRSAVTALLFFVILLVVTVSTMRVTNKNVHYEA